MLCIIFDFAHFLKLQVQRSSLPVSYTATLSADKSVTNHIAHIWKGGTVFDNTTVKLQVALLATKSHDLEVDSDCVSVELV